MKYSFTALAFLAFAGNAFAEPPPSDIPANAAPPASFMQHDGAHDFDFLIGDWKAHVWRMPDRLVGSNTWIEYTGISNHHKLLDSNANFEEFKVTSLDGKLTIKAQTLRLYNPDTHQWSIYGIDLDKGQLPMPPVVGQFTGKRGEFIDQELFKDGRAIVVRYVWEDLGPRHARMEQTFSWDDGRNWETNWICDLTR